MKFRTASSMLNDLAFQDGSKGLQNAPRRYCRPQLLVLDEVGYLSYDTRYGDLLLEVVSRKYANKLIIVTTNEEFSAWDEVFDRLVHPSEIVSVQGELYRLKGGRGARRRAREETSSKDLIGGYARRYHLSRW